MRYSLGFVLALSLAGLQFIAIIFVVSTSYVSSERAMLEHARGLMDEAGANAAEHTKRFLEPATEITEQARRMLDNGLVSTTAPAEMERYFFQLLRAETQLSGIYYGDESGNFVYVMNSDGPGPYRTKLISTDGEQRTTEYIWRDNEFDVVDRSFDDNDIFDARGRPWYLEARQLGSRVWTDPYIFFSSQQPGITVAAPIQGGQDKLHGVVGIDLDIADISLFLSDLTIGDSGAAFILSDDGRVIAHPDPARISTRNDDGTLGFIGINDFSDPIVRAAFADFDKSDLSANQSVQSEFTFSGDQYMTLLLPIPDIDLPWNIAVFAPENDFIQGIRDNLSRNIWIAAIISIVTAIAGLILAELILKPVRAFAVRTSLVSQGEVSTRDPLPRTYNELRAANETLINEIAQRRKLDGKLQDLNRELSHVTRVNMMGQMATGLAHELSQPLTTITQNLDTALSVAKMDPAPNEELISILTELDEQAHQGGDIIRALRSFVRKDKGTIRPFDLQELVEQTQRLLRQELEAGNITMDTQIPQLRNALGNRVQIAQVLINLLRNAADAILMADAVDRKITVTAVQLPDAIEVRVADTGPGVDPDMTLFKEFQTSKPDGLGLGLSISRTIVEAGGGDLWYDDASQQFRFTVPCETL
ncbi:ATP-binding protein [Loktanella sp. F6476L]|uniref:sensor histidine kinase n=1 Tax=Loktanella sp. F6476L TaxID=2926405 RepID=UPI001FF1C740|nr:cache domain-containing protein [Loktanella sp. F6476L]MCK0122510.1 ATP-binding protein [Loktanella sp. F6476L]